MKRPEAVLLLKQSDLKKIVEYVLSVPTGTLPGGRLADVLNTLDTLSVVPAQAVPMLEGLLKQIAKPSPFDSPGPHAPPEAKPNGAETPTAG